jgi:DNA circularisation protein N-terminus
VPKNQHDVLSRMLPTSFRDVAFEAERVELEFGHATVVHTYPGRDGGRVENLGRDPAVHTFRIHFLRSLDPDFYPNRFRKFLAAFSDGSAGPLVHPELGELTVKPNGKIKTAWEAGQRAGIVVEAVFIEADDDGEFGRAILARAPYDFVEQRAADAKKAILALPSPPDGSIFDKLDSAVRLLRKVTGAIDQARLSVSNVLASVAAVITACNDLMLAIEKTWDPQAYEGLLALVDVCNGAADQVENILGKKIVVKTILRDMPLESAARFVSMGLDDFLTFNPGLAAFSQVAAGTVVFAQGK